MRWQRAVARQENKPMGPDRIFQKLEPVSSLPFPNVEMLANDSKNCKTSRAKQNRREGQISASGCQGADLTARPPRGVCCLRAPVRPLRPRQRQGVVHSPPHSLLLFCERPERLRSELFRGSNYNSCHAPPWCSGAPGQASRFSLGLSFILREMKGSN